MVLVGNCILLSLGVVVFLLSGGKDVTGARCNKSRIGGLTCRPCGPGTRCVYCSSCLGYCHNAKKSRKQKPNKKVSNITYGTVEVPYKFPLLEMFKNIEAAIIADEISHLDVVEMYRVTSLALREDCEICNDVEEIKKLRDYTMSVHKTLKKLLDSIKFKDTAIDLTNKAHKKTDRISESVKTMVDPSSDIISDIPDSKLGLMLTGSGGGPADSPRKLKSVEIIHLNGTHRCSLPDFPNATWGHSQNSLTVCGNSDRMYRSNCFKLQDGAWTISHTLLKPRVYHSSWQSTAGIVLMGGVGYRSENNTETLSQINAESQLTFTLLNSSR